MSKSSAFLHLLSRGSLGRMSEGNLRYDADGGSWGGEEPVYQYIGPAQSQAFVQTPAPAPISTPSFELVGGDPYEEHGPTLVYADTNGTILPRDLQSYYSDVFGSDYSRWYSPSLDQFFIRVSKSPWDYSWWNADVHGNSVTVFAADNAAQNIFRPVVQPSMTEWLAQNPNFVGPIAPWTIDPIAYPPPPAALIMPPAAPPASALPPPLPALPPPPPSPSPAPVPAPAPTPLEPPTAQAPTPAPAPSVLPPAPPPSAPNVTSGPATGSGGAWVFDPATGQYTQTTAPPQSKNGLLLAALAALAFFSN